MSATIIVLNISGAKMFDFTVADEASGMGTVKWSEDVIYFAAAERVLAELPSAQPERKKGEWLPDNNCAYEMRFVCSCCKESEVVPTIGFTKYRPLWDFCPNCGADMRGEKHETD